MEHVGGGHHLAPHVGAHIGMMVQDARHRRQRHPSLLGHCAHVSAGPLPGTGCFQLDSSHEVPSVPWSRSDTAWHQMAPVPLALRAPAIPCPGSAERSSPERVRPGALRDASERADASIPSWAGRCFAAALRRRIRPGLPGRLVTSGTSRLPTGNGSFTTRAADPAETT